MEIKTEFDFFLELLNKRVKDNPPSYVSRAPTWTQLQALAFKAKEQFNTYRVANMNKVVDKLVQPQNNRERIAIASMGAKIIKNLKNDVQTMAMFCSEKRMMDILSSIKEQGYNQPVEATANATHTGFTFSKGK